MGNLDGHNCIDTVEAIEGDRPVTTDVREATAASTAVGRRRRNGLRPAPARSAPSDAELLSGLIGTIYDAALDRERWVDAVGHVTRFLDGYASVFGALDFVQDNYNLLMQWGYPPEYWQSYIDRYFHMNPLNGPAFRTTIGEVRMSSTFETFEELLQSQFYREWIAPQGIVDGVQGTVDKSASGIALITCTRHVSARLSGQAQIERMRLVLPHLRRAFLIGKLLDLHDARANTFAEAIDELTAGVFFVNAGGLLVHANAAGRAMLDDANPLKLVGGFPAATEAVALRVLREAFAAAAATDTALDTRSIAIPLAGRGGEPFTAHVLPLTSGERRRAGALFSASAVLFVRRATIDLPAAIGAASQLYGFTPAETRVLTVLIEVGGAAPVAGILGVARRTVQTHLEHLFEKTGTRRQAELVKLIAGYDAPVRRQTA